MTARASRIYKVCPRAEWSDAVAAGHHEGSADDKRDGFIHLSTREQLAGTLAKHYRGKSDLVLVAFDADVLGPRLRWEPSRGGHLFPHFYGSLPVSLAVDVVDLAPGPDGIPCLPEEP